MNALTPTGRVEEAVAALLAGRMIVVVDDADRENEGDLVLAAETVTEEQMAFLVRHTTGIICVPMPSERVDELKLPQMVEDNTDSHGTAVLSLRVGETMRVRAVSGGRTSTDRAVAAVVPAIVLPTGAPLVPDTQDCSSPCPRLAALRRTSIERAISRSSAPRSWARAMRG